MKSIETLNFVHQDAPNLVLISCYSNTYKKGWALKHFQNTHNIYVILHDINDNYAYYHDLTQKYNHIKALLDSLNLYKFSICSISFGGIIAYYLMFYFPERVTKAIIHDFHYNSSCNYPNSFFCVKEINTKNWTIPQHSDIPILFLLHRGSFVKKNNVLQIINIFTKIKFIFFINDHSLEYKKFKGNHHIAFFLFNLQTIKQFWNYQSKNFILNNNNTQPSKINKILIHIFLLLFNKYKI